MPRPMRADVCLAPYNTARGGGRYAVHVRPTGTIPAQLLLRVLQTETNDNLQHLAQARMIAIHIPFSTRFVARRFQMQDPRCRPATFSHPHTAVQHSR